MYVCHFDTVYDRHDSTRSVAIVSCVHTSQQHSGTVECFDFSCNCVCFVLEYRGRLDLLVSHFVGMVF